MKCNICGKEFKAGNKPNGLPNGLGYVLQDGRTVNICYECYMKAGLNKDFAEQAIRKLKESTP